MNEWREVRLGDVINFNPRESIAKGKISKKIAMEKLKPFCKFIDDYELAEFNGGAKFRNGDTLLARITPCLENGKTAQVNILDDDEVGYGSTEYIVLREKKNISDKDFIYYLSISQSFRDLAIKSMEGTTGRQRVQQSVLENTVVFLPPLPEQKAIAETLSCLDDKIELNNKINANLEQTAQAIFKSWFVDFEPFQDGEFVESELGRIPKGWRACDLSEIAKEIVCGKTPLTKIPEYYGGNIPFITIPDMHNKIYVTITERYLTEVGASSQANKTIPRNSVCVSCIATAGLVVLVSEKSQTNQQINSIVCNEKICPFYVFLTIKALSEHIRMLGSSGSTTCNLNKGQFSKIKMLLPLQDTMDDFADILQPIFETIEKNQHENAAISLIRDKLLPKLMTGEIDVK